jgi:hypothetical protein
VAVELDVGQLALLGRGEGETITERRYVAIEAALPPVGVTESPDAPGERRPEAHVHGMLTLRVG